MDRTRSRRLIATSVLIHLPILLGFLGNFFLPLSVLIVLLVLAMVGGFTSLYLMLCARCNRWVYNAENGWDLAGYRLPKNPLDYFWPRERCMHCGHQFDPR